MKAKNKNTAEFGQRLKTLRQTRGLTQEELAKFIGATKRTVEYYENSSKYPPITFIPAIARALKVSTDELLGVKSFSKDESLTTSRRLLRRFRKVEMLSLRDQRALFHFLSTLLKKTYLKKLHEESRMNLKEKK